MISGIEPERADSNDGYPIIEREFLIQGNHLLSYICSNIFISKSIGIGGGEANASPFFDKIRDL